MDFRKTYFLLPNLFTLAGLFFDAADGRIARLTKTQSELGLNLDSLSDLVTFGVAPGFVIYRWGLEDFGRAGLFIAFLFVAGGAFRLARFNVLSLRAKDDKPGKYMLGLPIPVAATVLISTVMAFHAIGINQTTNHILVAALVIVLSYLMISRVRIRSMKDVKLTKRTTAIIALLLASAVIVGVQLSRPAVLIFLVGCYITLGLVEEMVLLSRSRIERRLAAQQQATATAAVDEESEVLAELGVEEEPATQTP